MDFSSKMVIAAGIALLTLLINLPFGYMRKKTRKFSLKWFLCIHLPIPLIFLARVSASLNFRYIPVFVCAALAGQILGGKAGS
jgi:ABC-type spermidine/putrescine transport system permease subunit I